MRLQRFRGELLPDLMALLAFAGGLWATVAFWVRCLQLYQQFGALSHRRLDLPSLTAHRPQSGNDAHEKAADAQLEARIYDTKNVSAHLNNRVECSGFCG